MNDVVDGIVKQIHDNNVARDVFMQLFRESNQLSEQLTPGDCKEVFVSILMGSDDLSAELFDQVCHEYGTSLADVVGL